MTSSHTPHQDTNQTEEVIGLLRRIPLFAGLPAEDLLLLYEMSKTIEVKAGDLIIAEGDPGDAMYVLLDGQVRVTKRSGGQDLLLSVRRTGEFIGELSLLQQTPRSASVHALTDGRLLVVSRMAFQRMLTSSPAAPLAMLQEVTARLQSNESMLRQHEKMAALGTISAGLAHELNNPAAAVRRAAAQLRDAISTWESTIMDLAGHAIDADQQRLMRSLREGMAERVSTTMHLDALTVGEREREMEEWLHELSLEGAWELAPALVSAGWRREDLEKLQGSLPVERLAAILRWLAAGSDAHSLLEEVSRSAEGISEIVRAVKAYSFLDQAPVQAVDIHEGLENTLVILRHKMKDGITIRREYDEALPKVDAYGSELNQVWTNIIDNAIDAMGGSGEITIRTTGQADSVAVEICDTGAGIPEEIQDRIFEPFFTTKGPGSGTGLGLHIAHNIITNRHLGRISVESRPGLTCFRVSLPVRLQVSGS